MALLGDSIYAMGGFDGHVRQNSVERYNPDTNQWSLVQPMNHQRSDASATTLDGQFRFRSTLLYVHTDRRTILTGSGGHLNFHTAPELQHGVIVEELNNNNIIK